MTDEAEALMHAMSDLSETYYCAGWLSGLEFSLWAALDGKSHFGGSPLEREEIEKLKRLSEKCGGWIYWDTRHWNEPHRTGEVGETFIPLDEWKAMFEEQNKP